MKSLILCDDGKANEISSICLRFNFGIEMQAFYIPWDNTSEAIEKHLDISRKINLKCIHGCFADLNPGSFDPMVRDVAKQRFELSYKTAQCLQANNMVFHLGYVPHTSRPSMWLPRCTSFWKEFLMNKTDQIRFHIENMLELEPNLLSDLIDSLALYPVDANLDIGHAYCNSSVDPVKWIETLGKRIGYVHMHDNHGNSDEHLGFGQGTIPITEVCSALNQYAPDSYWAIEAEDKGMEISLNWLKDHNYIKA